MQRGHRHHGIERSSVEGSIKHIAVLPFNGHAKVARPRSFQYAPIHIEPNDVWHASLNQLRREDAVAAAHLQYVARSMRNGLDEQRVILNVRIPEPVRSHRAEDYS